VINWYCASLCCPGVIGIMNSIAQSFGLRDIHAQVEAYVKSFDICQCHKVIGKPNYWHDKNRSKMVHMDCAGSWMVCIQGIVMNREIEYQNHIYLMANACTNWLKLHSFLQQTLNVVLSDSTKIGFVDTHNHLKLVTTMTINLMGDSKNY
jgi:hypothetical protein